MPSYPETTGYIITTLLAYARHYGDGAGIRDAAIRMARWEIAVQMSSGAVQGGWSARRRASAAAFNTGMVLDGWCSVFEATGEREFLEAGRRAADFLVDDIDERGYFRDKRRLRERRRDQDLHLSLRVGPLSFGNCAGGQRYRDAAVRVIDAALRQQEANGWIAHNCLTRSRRR